MSVLVGAKLPHTGDIDPTEIAGYAVALERAGFDSLWVSDHIVLPERIESTYPFEADGVARWASDQPWLEAVVVMATAAAVTRRVRIGSAVLVAPQRNPVLLAKQIGSLQSVSAGRIELGVGAGWVREEFDALDADFDTRGARLTEWIELLRSCWTGRPAPHDGAHYRLPAGTLMLPPVPRPVPVLLGGHSPAALRRAGRVGDGWIGQQAVPDLDPDALADDVRTIRRSAASVGRDPARIRIVLRLVDSVGRHQRIAELLPALATAGVDELIVDLDGRIVAEAADEALGSGVDRGIERSRDTETTGPAAALAGVRRTLGSA